VVGIAEERIDHVHQNAGSKEKKRGKGTEDLTWESKKRIHTPGHRGSKDGQPIQVGKWKEKLLQESRFDFVVGKGTLSSLKVARS